MANAVAFAAETTKWFDQKCTSLSRKGDVVWIAVFTFVYLMGVL